MRLLRNLILSVLAVGLLAPATASAEELVSFKDAAKRMLTGAAKAAKLDVTPTEAEKGAIKGTGAEVQNSYSFLVGRDGSGAMVAAGIVIDQAGKEGPMRVGVALDPVKGTVKEAFVMRYEEERGKPVKEASWLAQFKGKDASAAFAVGKDVDVVSGATTSSKAVSAAVKKAVVGWKVLVLDRGTK